MPALIEQACRRDAQILPEQDIPALLEQLDTGWQRHGSEIIRTFHFENYYQTLAFINTIAQVAHKQDHHPDICFGYKHCEVRYSTHSVGGLSLNDFICAARIDLLASL